MDPGIRRDDGRYFLLGLCVDCVLLAKRVSLEQQR